MRWTVPLRWGVLLTLMIVSVKVPGTARAASDEVKYRSLRTVIRVRPDGSGATIEETRRGRVTGGSAQIGIAYSELEPVTDVRIDHSSPEGRRTKLTLRDARDRSIAGDVFYTDQRALIFDLPSTGDLTMSITRQCDELMLVSDLPLRSWPHADTIIYSIEVPSGMRLFHDRDVHPGIVSKWDSSASSGYMRYVLTVVPTALATGSERDPGLGLVLLERYPRMRLLLTHGALANDPWAYFHSWYERLTAPVAPLPPDLVPWADQFKPADGDTLRSIQRVFDEVKARIAYVDIEDHLNAFRPREAGLIWEKKKGDCKDMSNLLRATLRYLGMDAHLAISSTLSHPVDLDFPSLSSANHVVCAVRYHGTWLLLDATEDVCRTGRPSRHIQDRNVLIITPGLGVLHQVGVFPLDSNTVAMDLDLHVQGAQLTGTIQIRYSGMSALGLFDLADYSTPKEMEDQVRDRLAASARGLTVDSLACVRHGSEYLVRARVRSEGNITRTKEKVYLSLKAIPLPHVFPEKIPENCDLISYRSMHVHMTARVHTDEPCAWLPMEPVEVAQQGIRFDLAVSAPNERQVDLVYDYRDPYVSHRNERREAYNTVSTVMYRTLGKALIHEISP